MMDEHMTNGVDHNHVDIDEDLHSRQASCSSKQMFLFKRTLHFPSASPVSFLTLLIKRKNKQTPLAVGGLW